MIDITVDGTTVIIEGTETFDMTNPKEILRCLVMVLDEAKYGGEAIEVWVVDGEVKNLHDHWSFSS